MSKIETPLSWIGGKNRLKRKLVTMFPPHDIYVEPFLGAGHLLFWKKESKQEWVCDVDDLLINLWKVVKDPELHEKFVSYLTFHPKSRALFYEYREALSDPETYKDITPYIRAAMAYYLIKSSFGTMRLFTGEEVWGSTVGTDKMTGFYGVDWQGVFERLKDVIIENRDFREFLKIVNKKATKKTKKRRVFAYCDPPYFCVTKHPVACYANDFTMKDHEDLAAILAKFKGYWMLSIDDCEEAREMYKDFTIREVPTIYTSENVFTEGKRVTELVIGNYDIPEGEMQRNLFIDEAEPVVEESS